MSSNRQISTITEKKIQDWLPSFLSGLFLIVGLAVFFYALSLSITPCNDRIVSAQAQCNVGDTETFTGPTQFQDTIAVGATPVVGTTGQILASRGAGNPPEWSDGDTVTGVPTFLVKTADEGITNDAVLTSDADLQWTVIANSDYALWGGLSLSAGGAGSPDFRWNFSGPAGSTHDCVYLFDNGGLTEIREHSEAVTSDIDTDTQESIYTFNCLLRTAGTSGIYAFQWAQDASSATVLTMHKGSWFAWELLQ